MTARGVHAGGHAQDAEDLDVEEALALVNEGSTGDPAVPSSPSQVTPRAPGNPRKPDTDQHRATPWPEARAVAGRAVRSGTRRAPVSVPLDSALGLVLAAPLVALSDLPSFDTSAMDGWAVAGPGPWDVREDGVLAGHAQSEPLSDGEAVRIATGARIPRTPPPSSAANTAAPTTRAVSTRHATSDTARTSARAARNAAAATIYCPAAPW